MKRLTQIFQALLGVVALILTALVAAGRLAWRTIRNWWKKRSKWLRRSIATILILIPVGFVALVGYALYEDAYGRDGKYPVGRVYTTGTGSSILSTPAWLL